MEQIAQDIHDAVSFEVGHPLGAKAEDALMDGIIAALTDAVQEEREACAKVAEARDGHDHIAADDWLVCQLPKRIAAAIRGRA